MFCKFDHSHVFRKDNRVQQPNKDYFPVPKDDAAQFLCDLCGKVSSTKDSCNNHIESIHQEVKESTEQIFQCKECSSKFNSRSDLNSHVSQNHQGLDIECEQCGKYFVTRKELREHKIEHKEKSLADDKDIIGLTQSLQKLLNKSPIKSANRDQLIKEISVTNVKKMFYNTESLEDHMNSKHKVTSEEAQNIPPSKFKCDFCEINFHQVKDQNHHMDEMHGGRWKIGDDNVVLLGDDYEESSDDNSMIDEEISDTESSEIQSGEE